MLESFTDYLRASLGGLRRERTTVGDEIDLARSYLDLIGARMADRLRYRIECPDAICGRCRCRRCCCSRWWKTPCTTAWSPRSKVARCRFSAPRRRHLVLTVGDDGLGLNAPPRHGARAGNGVALDNLRQRLQAAYGSEARVELRDGAPGTLGSVRLPIDPPTA